MINPPINIINIGRSDWDQTVVKAKDQKLWTKNARVVRFLSTRL
jgi:hypothetical protein